MDAGLAAEASDDPATVVALACSSEKDQQIFKRPSA